MGYNGSPSRYDHCVDKGCILSSSGNCLRSIHAETNAIIRTQFIPSSYGAELWSTHQPCVDCTKLAIANRIATIVFVNKYQSEDLLKYYETLKQQEDEYCLLIYHLKRKKGGYLEYNDVLDLETEYYPS